jgi:hypothetical protein
MEDIWHMFPAQMGDHRAFITYNHGYSEIAKNDHRNFLLVVRVKFKNPKSNGMPTDEEFPALSDIDEKLEESLTKKGAVYVGRITVDGYRYFYFYLDFPKEIASEAVSIVSTGTSYKLQSVYREDSAKDTYWKDIYPNSDSWQVIQDMRVLDSLEDEGDKPDKPREVIHWAYFPDMKTANHFGEWVKSNPYTLISIEFTDDEGKVGVHFSHIGTMVMEDITHHTIGINRKVTEMKGDYDGWETSVER